MTSKIAPFALLLLATVATPAVAIVSNAVLGQTALNEARIDGALVPEGTTVLSPSKIQSGKYPAAVHLATGQTLNLGPNSSARIAAAPEGRISLAAESGTVEVGIDTGEVFKLAMNAVAMLEEGGPGTGDPVVKIKVCDENHNLIEWDAADIENCHGENVEADVDVQQCYLPKTTYDEETETWQHECREGAAGAVVAAGAGGLLAGGGGLLVLGVVGAGVLGYEIAHKEDRTIACGVPDASGNVPPGTNPPGVGGCP